MDKKPGRNDPCPCGSGKKYKSCCLAKEEPKKSTYTEAGKRKFKATVLSAGDARSQSLFQGLTPSGDVKREIKPLDLSKFKKSKEDYRAKPSEEPLPFEMKPQEGKPKPQDNKPEELPDIFEGTEEDFRQ